MSMRTVNEPITWNPQKITVAGASGSGKTTLCDRLAELLGIPRVEIDSLHHGPGWTRRPSFVADVEKFIAGPRWIIELQYREVRPMIVARADTLIWLDYSTSVQMSRLIRRTVSRRIRRTQLWNGNYEPPLRTCLTDDDHILRWGWRTRNKLKPVVPTLEDRFPGLTIVRLETPRETRRWMEVLAQTS